MNEKDSRVPITPLINQNNVESVRFMINKKKSSNPYYATVGEAGSVLTDYDHFPYTRNWRGVYDSPVPVVNEREAGWRSRNDSCYDVNIPVSKLQSLYPNHCFEVPCSTVFPCYPEYLAKYSDRAALNVMLNKACIVQYR
jgi:hypothetical protein